MRPLSSHNLRQELMIILENAEIGYRTPVLRCDVRIEPGDFVIVEGANGAGKSTLLKTLAGLLEPLSGRRTVGFKRLGWVPQQEAMDFPLPINVREMVALGASASTPFWRRFVKPTGFSNAALEALLEPDWMERPVSQLSGGQRQRLLLARALAANPDCLLLDEPTAGVDVRTQTVMASVLSSFQVSAAGTVVMVTHEPGAFLKGANGFLKAVSGTLQKLDVSERLNRPEPPSRS